MDGLFFNAKVPAEENWPPARHPKARIDPLVRTVAFWNNDSPVAVLSYYATHPQSYYGQGSVNWDFVGIARDIRETALPGVPHIHFDGAGGNVAAGKYNDGTIDKTAATCSATCGRHEAGVGFSAEDVGDGRRYRLDGYVGVAASA